MDSGKGTKMSTKDRILERLLESEVAKDRRERIATACMSGLMANPEAGWSSDEAARLAVECADSLIAELDKEAAS